MTTAGEKTALIAALRAQIAEEREAMRRAAKDAAEAATHEEAKPENDKDTRGLEQSYLARGQAERVRALERDDNALQFLVLRDYADGDAIGLGALVEVEAEGDDARALYFLLPAGGGMKAAASGVVAQVVTPEAPLGRALIGKEVGDSVTVRGRAMEIVAIR
jgi:transcription elongation GreA/GreB family factor